MNDRDCEKCIHKVNGACNVWDCEFEPCKDAISRQAVLDAINTDFHEDLSQLEDAIKALPPVEPKTGWIPVSEDLPKDFGTYLITLEGGDVCKCEFNPDFIDEEHENGAFTYYHQYFDQATLGMIDEEEEAVDAIAWMPFEPYDPQESEG